jgi:hypothetical protein
MFPVRALRQGVIPMRRLLVLVALFFSLPAQAVTIDWVPIGNANNPADTLTNCWGANCGSVNHAYYISKYEVANAQYAEFLNAKAASDPLDLYHPSMGVFGFITRSGVSGSFTYTAEGEFENKPVTFVSFYDALRFSNWLNNGQGSADTETGAYTLLGGTATPSNGPTVTRGGADIFLPSENEWYKAAYYSPGGVYFEYPTGTDNATDCVLPGADTGNSANCWPATSPSGAQTDAGAYGLSASPYGTYDQGGNVNEWNEQILSGSNRGNRGGGFGNSVDLLAASYPYYGGDPMREFNDLGFRVASFLNVSATYDESVSGDLPGSPEPPLALEFVAGGNRVLGAVEGGVDVFDEFSFTLAPGEQLDSVILNGFVGDSNSTVRFFRGTNTGAPPPAFLGETFMSTARIGSDYLDLLGLGPRGPGVYSISIVGGPGLHSYDFILSVPEPGPAGAALGLVVGLGTLCSLRRARAASASRAPAPPGRP